jgi:quercetin dioxygenase-like cupin family protein
MRGGQHTRGLAGNLRHRPWLAAVPVTLLWLAGDAAPRPPAAAVSTLMQRDLADLPGKEALLLTVEYPPAGASLPHRHDADVFVYVLAGEVVMQLAGQPARTLGPGATFYEGTADVHVRSENSSATAPAKLLVFMVKDKGRPVSQPPAPPQAQAEPR